MRKIYSSLLVILSVLILFSCKSEDKYEGFKKYENEEKGFSIKYPENWNYREGFAKEIETGSIVVFQSPSEGKRDLFLENVHVFTEPLPDSVKNVDDYLEYSKIYLPSQLQEMEILEEGKSQIDGQQSRWIIFNYVNRLQRVTSIGYIFYKNDEGFAVVATARPEDFMGKRRLFEKIVTSIKFE